uniref:Bifunctional adenosylcobalamin biosynthesis protein n=1 Tax=Candidatus Kentrum sp. LPFa TaxID=2126335 RepID=A0A450WP86_9GAMM|nr:MAG: adenosylcobinamide kinase /adenosylcobinamide-phosphate guanylyltransferase [Candidatus Kentron sp. LPFa]
MSEITLITGGCRSGKSRYARRVAEDRGGKRLFIATAPILDDEMRHRVARHRAERHKQGWDTWEEQYDLADRLRQLDPRSAPASKGGSRYDVVLCDCLTLWVNNLLFASKDDASLEEDEMAVRAFDLCAAARAIPAPVFLVTNEVGLGIVPADKISRRFRDLAGRCNQEVAAVADSVILMVSGLPVPLKGLLKG